MNLFERYQPRFPEQLAQLQSSQSRGRMAHGFLLSADSSGLRGDLARLLAQFAACPDVDASGRPCGRCRVCRGIADGTLPELFTLTPEGKACDIKIGDADNPEANTVRCFVRNFQLTRTGEGRNKVGIIFDADRMNVYAQNALLKTLEEPPRESVIILATGNPAALLPTTISRCCRLDFCENRTVFEFADFDRFIGVMHALVFEAQGDPSAAAALAGELCAIASALEDAAEESSSEVWSARIESAKLAEDPALNKRIEKLRSNAASGLYRQERFGFLGAIVTYMSQVYLLASGAAFADLPNPEFFPDGAPPPVDPPRAERMLREAEQLSRTLRFMVNEELALRAFAANVVLA